jgi:hypothetical protein
MSLPEFTRMREPTEWIVSYWYNADDYKLPRILLIGDSICNGYQPFVRDKLAGKAYVSFYASSKCVTDCSYLRELSYILGEYEYSIIHYNNGLHSLDSDRQAWERGLRTALGLIRERSWAKLIWTSSTPSRKEELTAQVMELNAIAAHVMDELSIPIDDLFTLMNPLDRKEFWTDDYHYAEAGRKLQAHQVADTIRATLRT